MHSDTPIWWKKSILTFLCRNKIGDCYRSDQHWSVIAGIINLFMINVPILYLLKTPEKFCFSAVFRKYKMGALTGVGVNRSSRPEVSLEISQNSQENICARLSFLIKLQVSAFNFIRKETLAQVFFSEFCNISKNPFSYRTPPEAASG